MGTVKPCGSCLLFVSILAGGRRYLDEDGACLCHDGVVHVFQDFDWPLAVRADLMGHTQ